MSRKYLWALLLISMLYWAFVTPQAETVLELFRSTGAYLQGHFRLTSGLHSGEYLQSALVLRHPEAAERLGRMLAEEFFRLTGKKIGLVVSPALGGLIIGNELAPPLAKLFSLRNAT